MERPPHSSAPTTLSYATPDIPANAGDLFLEKMLAWRGYTGYGMLFCLFAPLVWTPAALAALSFVLFAAVMTLVYMARYAANAFDTGYAARHVILAVALCPLLLLGVFLVTRLVQADVERLRLRDDRLEET